MGKIAGWHVSDFRIFPYYLKIATNNKNPTIKEIAALRIIIVLFCLAKERYFFMLVGTPYPTYPAIRV
ncbi:MAG: hypothetical protein KGI08_01940 [Thaumarchaeota archaeon]|nr:hypothetical protein [Nitrososphaerota archaeon]